MDHYFVPVGRHANTTVRFTVSLNGRYMSHFLCAHMLPPIFRLGVILTRLSVPAAEAVSRRGSFCMDARTAHTRAPTANARCTALSSVQEDFVDFESFLYCIAAIYLIMVVFARDAWRPERSKRKSSFVGRHLHTAHPCHAQIYFMNLLAMLSNPPIPPELPPPLPPPPASLFM
jgi:hypothetical protein